MLDIVKDTLSAWVEKLNQEIDDSADGSTVIDLAIIFERLLSGSQMLITFGEDISPTKVPMDVRAGPMSSKFVKRQLSLPEAAREFDDAVFDLSPWKWQCRWYQAIRALTGIKNFTNHHKTVAANGKAIRDILSNYIK